MQVNKASQQSSINSQGSTITGKSNVSSASAAIIEQRDQTINQKDQTLNQQNLQIHAIMDQLQGLQARHDPARNANNPKHSQQPRQAPLDKESMEAGDGDFSGKGLDRRRR
jgi:hypothetical protein